MSKKKLKYLKAYILVRNLKATTTAKQQQQQQHHLMPMVIIPEEAPISNTEEFLKMRMTMWKMSRGDSYMPPYESKISMTPSNGAWKPRRHSKLNE